MHVQFSSILPSEGEFFEKYDEYNGLTAWAILLYVLRSFIPFLTALQGFFDVPSTINLFIQHVSGNLTSSFYSSHCKEFTVIKKREYFNISANPNMTVDCNKENLVIEMHLSKNLGFSVGAIFSGILADLFGRRIVCLCASSSWMIFTILLIFLRDIRVLTIVYCGLHICCSATNVVSFVNYAEICNKKNRILSAYTIPSYVLGSFILFLTSRELQSWKYCTALNVSVGFVVIFATWYIPESPRWLLNKNKQMEVYEQLTDISGLNYDIYPDKIPKQPESDLKLGKIFVLTMKYAFVTKLKYTLVFLVLMNVSTFFYSCGKWKTILMFIHTEYFGLFVFTSEATSYLFIIPIYFFLGKRFGLVFMFILMIIGTFMVIGTYGSYTITYFSIFAVLLGISCLSFEWLYMLDVFPTFVRTTVVGTCFCMFGINTMCSIVLTDHLEVISDVYYYLTFGLIAMCGMAVLLLPTTSKIDLPNAKILP